jgi:DNA-binding NtrC family response regulator
MMSDHYFALLVHEEAETFECLKASLHRLGVETYSVATCREAKEIVSICKPHVVFSAVFLADGSWSKVLNYADELDVPLSVVVVAPHPDTKLYVSVMQRGAFDFVAPPFECEPLTLVLRSAVFDALRRRDEAARAANALQELVPRNGLPQIGASCDLHTLERGVSRFSKGRASLKAKA